MVVNKFLTDKFNLMDRRLLLELGTLAFIGKAKKACTINITDYKDGLAVLLVLSINNELTYNSNDDN